MDHHPQVLEDVIDIYDVRLKQATCREMVHVRDFMVYGALWCRQKHRADETSVPVAILA